MPDKILVLGASGMLGHTLFTGLEGSLKSGWSVKGTVRSGTALKHPVFKGRDGDIFPGVDAFDFDSIVKVFAAFRPQVVINCIGIVKQVSAAREPIAAITVNAVFPHRLAELCQASDARLIHFSTDCVFRGDRGSYKESDPSDADDLYGKSKFLGEIADRQGCITLRTSIIGHELHSRHGLVDWFLCQTGTVQGFAKAIFSGLPTVEIARVLREFVLPRRDLAGTYHLSGESISKYDLLRLIAQAYGKDIVIERDERVEVDRSLDSDRFRDTTGYVAPDWKELVDRMHENARVEGIK